MAFQLVQLFYWLALSTWFGGVMFIAIAAPIIFRTVRKSNPILTHVLSVNLEGQHATLLAGSIVANILLRVSQWSLGCAAVVIVALAAQFFVADVQGASATQSNIVAAAIRCILCLGAAGITLYDRFVIWPVLQRHRQTYIDHADEPEVANPAKERFDREHRRSMTMMTITLGLLLLLILYSSSITPRKTAAPASAGHGAAVEGMAR